MTVAQRAEQRTIIAQREMAIMARKKRYQTPEDFEAAVEAYFEAQDNHFDVRWKIDKKTGEKTKEETHRPRPYTIAGLVLYLGFATRDTLNAYAIRDGYDHIVTRAFLRIEEQLSESLSESKGAIAGPIFALKCAFGWQEEGLNPQNVVNNVQINVGQAKIGLSGMPPEPKNLEEWTQMYNQHIGVKVPELPQGLDDCEDASFIEIDVDDIINK